jgi:hypothetical protein
LIWAGNLLTKPPSLLTFPAFFVTICYHTIYATPWIFPPVDTVDTDADLEAGEGEGPNEIVHEKREAPAPVCTEDDEDELPGREEHLILEGPYGGPCLRAREFERVLLFAGGSGVTFTLGVLDELEELSILVRYSFKENLKNKAMRLHTLVGPEPGDRSPPRKHI